MLETLVETANSVIIIRNLAVLYYGRNVLTYCLIHWGQYG